MFAAMTKITRDAFQGKKFTGERDNTDNRRLNPRKRDRAKTSATPRTRSGKEFPGGKRLRAALKTLTARQKAFDPGAKGHQGRKPGSMRG